MLSAQARFEAALPHLRLIITKFFRSYYNQDDKDDAIAEAIALSWRRFHSLIKRGIDPDNLWDAMRVIREDFGHPANLGRAGDPREIGPVIAFAGSRVNSYMTGADINVDGGSDF